MNCPISYSYTKKKRTINPDSMFILIGNAIDGQLDFKICEFENFDHLKTELFNILSNIKATGEWTINLYQVEQNYRIRHKYGYYKIPSKGKLIYTYSYMDSQIKQINFEKNRITFFNTSMDYFENWLSEGEDFHNYSLDIDILQLEIK